VALESPIHSLQPDFANEAGLEATEVITLG
jgi:hypothetical protein